MDKVIVKTGGLSQALFSLATAGCDTVEVSVVEHAVKVEGIRDDERLTLHVWSKEAEDTAEAVGKGEKLTEEEIKLLDKGKCPKCPDHGKLYARDKQDLAINVSCDAGHLFWIPKLPLLPEYLGQHKEEEVVEEVKEEVEEVVEEVKEPEEVSEVSDTK